jgi:hypothetical protein
VTLDHSEVSEGRRKVAAVLLLSGSFFTLLALFGFAFGLVLGLSRAEGEGLFMVFFFVVLMGVPAFLLTIAAILVRGWRAARTGYYCLSCLFGIPLLTFLVVFVLAHVT